MNSDNLGLLSTYERQAWDRIQRWREAQATRRSRVPAPVRTQLSKATDLASRAWSATPGNEVMGEVVGRVLSAGNQAVADAVAVSLRRERILEAARRHGAPVYTLADLHRLDLQTIDEILPSLNLRYAATSAATGAASGLVAGGGTAAIAGTAGAAAAPGALAVGGALAADVVATIALAARVVTHYAGYCGYDTREETEKAVLLAVIGAGITSEGVAKGAALVHVRQVAMMIARRATWKELSEEAAVKLVQNLFARLSVNLTKQKLGQAIPVFGIAAGAGLNYGLMRRVGTTASFMYRERFLIDKYSLDVGDPTLDLDDVIDAESSEVDPDAGSPDEEPHA